MAIDGRCGARVVNEDEGGETNDDGGRDYNHLSRSGIVVFLPDQSNKSTEKREVS